jgi:ABC-type ATPase with predicted acetyltransferase domain
MNAEQAWQHWQKSMKVNLQVYTDKQLFELGFNAAQTIINETQKVIAEMEKEHKKMAAEIKKLRKPQE